MVYILRWWEEVKDGKLGLLQVPTCLGCWGWGSDCSIIIICNKGVIDRYTHLSKYTKVHHWQAKKTQRYQAIKAINHMPDEIFN